MTDSLLNFLSKYKYHFIVWGIYTAYEVIFTGILAGKFTTIDYYIFYSTFYIPLFYFHANVLLKYTLQNRKGVRPILLFFAVLIELALFILLKHGSEILVQRYLKHNMQYGQHITLTNLAEMVWRPMYFLGYSTGYYFLKRVRRQRQLVEEMQEQELKNLIQEKEIKNELILTQNAFLRSQINQDFLLNTLSSLYDETRESAPKAAESILSLADIMQYALSKEASSGFVKLEKEISLIENFLLLHQARQVHQPQFKFSYTKESLSISFIPLVLMTLTENILKHGKLDDPTQSAEIKITYANSILCIETSNKESGHSKIPSHGIGLKNIKERLYLAYGDAASFNYHLDSKNYFYASIEVQT
ncbi:sensor histidine kinase YesM [Pedobacter cryoconitis]|uniref:sensor histidine kinase n=1 Tax=Pedobacter cryoconitis TaxID=188932 RepID=UPI00161F2F72|nr:sensor histidine kinase [Pedobacter cryoconitis]MBB6273773.1 sensor histidine kinase YesM [Pedobacter cryoconitis]